MKEGQKTQLLLTCFISLIGLCFISCNSKRVEITSEYIINENWNKTANSIEVSRMKPKANKTINLNDLNQGDVVDNLEIDSSFLYFANVNSTSALTSKKIYFNKDNGFVWGDNLGERVTNVLGNLKRNYWYRISLDTYQNKIYIFLDSLNGVHRQDVVPTNY